MNFKVVVACGKESMSPSLVNFCCERHLYASMGSMYRGTNKGELQNACDAIRCFLIGGAHPQGKSPGQVPRSVELWPGWYLSRLIKHKTRKRATGVADSGRVPCKKISVLTATEGRFREGRNHHLYHCPGLTGIPTG